MAGVITTGNFPKAQWPGIQAWYGRSYDKHTRYDVKMFDISKSKKSYEENVEATGLGLAPVKAQAGSVYFDSESQGTVTRYSHVAYGLGFIVSREEMDDNLYKDVARTRAEALAFSMYTTRQMVAANVLNRGFNASYVGGDGVSMLSTAHPTEDGTQSNTLAIAADLSEASLEDMLIQIRNAKNSRGLPISLQGDCLIVSPNDEFTANRILFSTLQAGSANNDINAVRSMGMLPKGIVANPYLTDTNAWFVKTNVPHGLKGFDRTPMTFTRDNDFDTDNMKAKAYERYAFGWTDWRGIYGTAGAV